MNLKDSVAKYFKLEQEIHDYFGYKQDWVTISLEDRTTDYWMIIGDGDKNTDMCVYSPEPLTKESIEAGDNIYSGNIYTQRFLSKWVYRAEDHTLVAVDTRTDGNKFLMIFSNNRECKGLGELYLSKWGRF